MAGTLTISTLSDGTNSTSATNCIQGSAKAWVRFAGSGSSATVNASYNVSSVTRGGLGFYTVNLTNALTDGNASMNVNSNTPGYNCSTSNIGSITSTTASFQVTGISGTTNTGVDATIISVAIFR